jgi:hypothetical protein
MRIIALALLFALYSPEAFGARCRFPLEFFRPSTGACEIKAGSPYYRGAFRVRPPALKEPRHPHILKKKKRKPFPVMDIVAPPDIMKEEPAPPPVPLPPIRPEPSIIDKRWPA